MQGGAEVVAQHARSSLSARQLFFMQRGAEVSARTVVAFSSNPTSHLPLALGLVLLLAVSVLSAAPVPLIPVVRGRGEGSHREAQHVLRLLPDPAMASETNVM